MVLDECQGFLWLLGEILRLCSRILHTIAMQLIYTNSEIAVLCLLIMPIVHYSDILCIVYITSVGQVTS